MEPAIEVKNLNYTYADGTKALNGISFAIEKHKKVALLGENGSGKSTLILHLNGLHRPTTGQIRVLGLSVDDAHIDTVRTKVGMIFQNPDDQIFAPTVYQDVAFGLRNLGFSEPQVARMVGEILDLLGIAHLKHKSPDKLSGGEKRRVALAGILVMNPEIIVLDEPHSGLDPNGHLELNDLLDELHSKGRTMIVATHDVEFVASWADEILIMKDGNIIAHGSPYDVFSDLTMLREANLKLPTVISIYNELKSRNFVFRGDEIPLDIMDLVSKVESPNIKFLQSSNAPNKGTIVGIEYSGESWTFSAHKGKGKILTYDDDIAVVELLDGSLPSYGDITIFKVHDDERYDALVAERVKAEINDGANRAQNIKIGAMGTNAKLLAKHHGIRFDFGVDVINKAVSYAARGHNVILLASGMMAEHAGKKIYKIRPDIFFHYVNFKNEGAESELSQGPKDRSRKATASSQVLGKG